VGYDGLRRSLANILFYSLFIMFHIEIYNGYDVPKSKLVGVHHKEQDLIGVKNPVVTCSAMSFLHLTSLHSVQQYDFQLL
jgi:hypothetical protein